MSEDAHRLFARLALAVLIGWPWTAHGQNPSAEPGSHDDEQMITGDQKSQSAGREENSSSRDLANHVRKAIAKDKSVSAYAHKVKVIPSVHGTVTLKGRVRSEEERYAVEAKAAEIAGAGNVNTELFVAGNLETGAPSRQQARRAHSDFEARVDRALNEQPTAVTSRRLVASAAEPRR